MDRHVVRQVTPNADFFRNPKGFSWVKTINQGERCNEICRNVPGDGGDKVEGGEDLKISIDLGFHAGWVDDGAVPVHGVGGLNSTFSVEKRLRMRVT
jgi:hypothetical protein